MREIEPVTGPQRRVIPGEPLSVRRGLRFSPGLQGLRGVAIAMVVAAHCFPQIMPGGWVGVDLFFVLSGYLITSLLVNEWRRTGGIDFRAFYVRRARRLLPALALYLPAALAVMVWLGEPEPFGAAAAGAAYVMNISLAAGHFNSGQSIAPLWSLSQEEQFYLLWPAVLLALLAWKGPRAALMLAVALAAASAVEGSLLAAHGVSTSRLYFAPDTHALPLMLGCAAGLHGGDIRHPRALGALSLVVLVALALTLRWTDPDTWHGGTALVSLACLGLVCSADSLPLLRAEWLQGLGLYSYGIYLWHPVALAAVGKGAMVPVALALAGAAAVASFHLVEQPVRRMRVSAVT